MSNIVVTPDTTPRSSVTLTLDHGRQVTLDVPLQSGTYEHLSEQELFEVCAFIRAKSLRSNDTRRAYVRQLEKFLIWMRLNKVKTIDEWVLMDYQQALLKPNDTLRQLDGIQFNDSTEDTVDNYFDIIRGFVRHLHEKGLLAYNPAKFVSKLGIENKAASTQPKHFTPEQFNAVLDTIEQLPDESRGQRNRKERLRFCIRFQYAMGLRIHEMARHRHSHIQRDGIYWQLRVIGKGRRARNLRLDEFALEALRRYRLYLGLSAEPNGEPLPLLPTINPVTIRKRGPNPGVFLKDRLTTASNWQTQFNEFIEHDVMVFLCGDDPDQAKLQYEQHWQYFSPHALRHTRLTDLAKDDDKNLLWVQQFAGHENLNTTARYFHI